MLHAIFVFCIRTYKSHAVDDRLVTLPACRQRALRENFGVHDISCSSVLGFMISHSTAGIGRRRVSE